MDFANIEKRVIQVISTFTFLDYKALIATMDLKRDLGLDSLDRSILAIELEDAFDLEVITDAEIAAVATVGDPVTLIANKKGE